MSLPVTVRWGKLVAAAAVLTALLLAVRVPAALLLGPMLAAAVARLRGVQLAMPKLVHGSALAVLGCLTGSSLTAATLATILGNAPLFFGVVMGTILCCAVLGWGVARWGSLPGTTAIWGLSPGAGAVMVMVGRSYGADPSLVAVMQYLRLIVVVLVAAAVARLWFHIGALPSSRPVWLAPVAPAALAITLLVAAVGGWAATRLRIAAAGVMVPMLLAGALQVSGLVHLAVPPLLQAVVFAILGFTIGLGFSRDTLLQARRNLGLILLSIFLMIAMCALAAWVLVHLGGVDPLTAFLATSPGGIDSAAVIAVASGSDLAFVMAMQVLRFLLVIVIAPWLARVLSRRADSRA